MKKTLIIIAVLVAFVAAKSNAQQKYAYVNTEGGENTSEIGSLSCWLGV